MMRALALTLLLVIGGGQAHAADEPWRTDPTAFINHFAAAGIEDILTADIDDVEKAKRFRTLFNDGFDIPAISRFVIGRTWRRTTDADKDAFIALFEDVIVYTWSRRFSEYTGQSIEVRGTSPDGDIGTLVDSVIVDDDGQTISAQWRLRLRDDGLRIVDVIIEGVSMAITYRQDYASVIRQQGGMSGLLDLLGKQVVDSAPS
ncbi:MAG: ABC transporter substrate-binding protein [Rhodospirillaceae bacterium]|jgi:phospholipid transport system substrate-binding protein|nr:ABC transporter substrate-binding protein [Rhodospirillaceae bacterium]